MSAFTFQVSLGDLFNFGVLVIGFAGIIVRYDRRLTVVETCLNELVKQFEKRQSEYLELVKALIGEKA